jgi:membrane-associated protein
MQYAFAVADFIIHIDKHLGDIIANYGTATYAVLFTIVFAETGFVLTPFLPGDSLLFAAGAFAAAGALKIMPLFLVFWIAAFIGDTVNYWLGRFLGKKMLRSRYIPINDSHIEKTNAYFARYGGKTIFFAKFIPIVRTFAPFVAGVGKMPYRKFLTYNFSGGLVWVSFFTFAGYFFGNIPFIKENFSVAVIVIILLSVAPIAAEYLRMRWKKRSSRP